MPDGSSEKCISGLGGCCLLQEWGKAGGNTDGKY